MELANLQLAEFEAYDRLLDEALDRSYRDLVQHPIRPRAHTMRDLKEIRIDLARLSDELTNALKFSATGILPGFIETSRNAFTWGLAPNR